VSLRTLSTALLTYEPARGQAHGPMRIHAKISAAALPPPSRCVRDDELQHGDLCTFWDVTGIYMGVVDVDFLDVSQTDNTLGIWFNLKGPDGHRQHLKSTLTFTLVVDERVKPEDVTVHAFLIENELKYLPRVVSTAKVEYDDGLRVVSRL